MVYTRPMSVGQAAQICHASQKSVLNWIYEGALKAFTTYGGHYRVWPINLKEFLDSSGMEVPFEYDDTSTPRIVIIDDNQSYSEALSQAIHDRLPGVEIRVAEDGFEGLMLISELNPRLIILDLHMPGMGGVQVLDLLRRRGVQHPMKILVLSCDLDSHSRQQVVDLGVDVALDKLSEINFTLQTIAALLGTGEPPTLANNERVDVLKHHETEGKKEILFH